MRMRLPEEFRRRMERLLGEESAAFYAALDGPAHRGLRVNTLKCTIEAFRKRFPLPLTPVPFSPAGFLLHGDWKAGADPWHHAGAYYMQEPSAMAPAAILDPRPGEAILDLCAAPAARQPASPPPSKAGACFGPMRSSGPGRRSCSKTSSAAGSGTPSSPGQSPLYSPKSWGRGLTGSWSMPLARERGCSARNRPLWNNGVPAISRCVPGGSAVSCAVPPASSAREGGCCIPPAHLPRRKTNGRWGRSWSNTRISFWKTSGRLDSAALAFPRRAVSAFSLPEDGPLSAAIPFERCRRILPQDGGEGHFLALFRKKGDAGASLFSIVQTKFDTFGIEIQKLYNECFCSKPEGAFQRFGRIIRLLPASLPDLRGLPILGAGCAAAEIKETGRGAVRLEPLPRVVYGRAGGGLPAAFGS